MIRRSVRNLGSESAERDTADEVMMTETSCGVGWKAILIVVLMLMLMLMLMLWRGKPRQGNVMCYSLRGSLGFVAPEMFLGDLLAGWFIDNKRWVK